MASASDDYFIVRPAAPSTFSAWACDVLRARRAYASVHPRHAHKRPAVRCFADLAAHMNCPLLRALQPFVRDDAITPATIARSIDFDLPDWPAESKVERRKRAQD
jgi:hypothetical protein